MALAGQLAADSRPGEVTRADARGRAGAVLARLLAHRDTGVGLLDVPFLAVAGEALVLVLAILGHGVAAMVTIPALIF